MAKIILEFNGHEEAIEAQEAIDGNKWKASMWELDERLRQTTKYGRSVIHSKSEEADEFEQDIAGKYRDIIREIIQGHGLNLF